jgi:lipoprotein NlpI
LPRESTPDPITRPTEQLAEKPKTMSVKASIVLLVLAWTFFPVRLQADDKADELLQRALKAAAERKHEQAIAVLDELLALDPKHGRAYDKRGEERFKLGRFKESIEDFDRAIQLGARREREHWQRGIAYYYAGAFEKGQKQFEAYQTYQDNDVENAVWRYLCMAKRTGGKEGVEKARGEILKIRRDTRLPMMEVYDLYAGKLKPDDVLAAAKAGDPKPAVLNSQLFYAHLYLGLYYDAAGDTKLAAEQMDQAVKHKIGDYMWDVAKVHADVLKRARK